MYALNTEKRGCSDCAFLKLSHSLLFFGQLPKLE